MCSNSFARHFSPMFHAKCLLTRLDKLPPVRSWVKYFYQCLHPYFPSLWYMYVLYYSFLPTIYRFGVCCLFIVSATSTTINENCTYIQNPSFPSVYADTTSLTYTINKCSDTVCNVRLDFETFTTKGPAATTEDAAGNACAGMES